MKAKAIIFTGLVSAAISLAPSSLQAKDASDDKARQPGSVGEFSPPPSLPPPLVDRANNVIGMRVENPSNQTLGTVTDIVFDLQTGRISYVVMKKAGPAHGTGKYAAIPPSALAPSPDMKHLVLNTDKAAMQHSKGFSRNNYPPVGEPAYGAQPSSSPAQQQIIIVPVVPSGPDQDQTPDEQRNPDKDQDRQPMPDQGSNPNLH